MEIAGRFQQSAPNCEEIGVRILEIGNFNINFSAEDQRMLREANKARGEARRGVGIANDQAQAKQFALDQKFQQDARYVQHLAGNWNNYAAGNAMMGAGEGMAKGGANVGMAQLGAQAAMGVNMASMMQPQQYAPPPNFAAGAPQFQGGQPQQPQQAQGQPAQQPAAGGGATTIEARLQKLAALKQQGLISDEDFNARKAKILEEI